DWRNEDAGGPGFKHEGGPGIFRFGRPGTGGRFVCAIPRARGRRCQLPELESRAKAPAAWSKARVARGAQGVHVRESGESLARRKSLAAAKRWGRRVFVRPTSPHPIPLPRRGGGGAEGGCGGPVR